MVEVQRTLVLVKPDGVQRGLSGAILARLEARGLKLVGLKLLQMDRELAARHYAEHQGKPFYKGLVKFITSAPIVAAVLEGPRAVEAVRSAMGKTNPTEAAPGTIRGDLALEMGRNLIHGSDSPESAAREVALFFKASELVAWRRDADPWIIEKP
ncbi:MAG: nucleoside-diphosphate kinase [Chloroflexi bacterium]|nr:nucleoside-diphosphate kinase [Chloroflexota bacterium]